MKVSGDYRAQGYAHLQGLVPPEVAQAFVATMKQDIAPDALPVSRIREFPNLLVRPAFEISGYNYPPMAFFLWGLTPIVSEVVGRELLPTYVYLRMYREGDICRVHHDRPACEHSLSLTMDYSDGVTWPLDVETAETQPSAAVSEDFGANAYGSVPMAVGDAVLYRGVHHRHGRVVPNPNGWSVHLFLHWVDRDGPFRDQAFDGHPPTGKPSFQFT
jgi:hypothetical protein